MTNRHDFESIKRNSTDLEVVSSNQRNFESTITNRNFFEVIVSQEVNTSDSWRIDFVQSTQLIAVLSSQREDYMEIASSTAIELGMTLNQLMSVQFALENNLEIMIDFNGDMQNIEFISTSGFENLLRQKLNIYFVDEVQENLAIEIVPIYKHYFLLDNFSGSTLSTLDTMDLVDMDYEII